MSLNLSKASGGSSGGARLANQELLEEATYPCRVLQIIDLGLQKIPDFNKQPKDPKNKVYVTYELLDEFCVDEDGEINEEKPRWISEEYKVYNLKADKAISTQRYNALDPTCVHGGDLSKTLGLPCLVTVVHNIKQGKTYANVGSLSPMREKDKAKAPELVNKPVVFLLDEPDVDVFKSLPEFLQDKVKANLEFQGSKLQKLLGQEPEEEEEGQEEPEDNDDNQQEEETDGEW